MRRDRAALTPEVRQTWSNTIFKKVISHPLYRHAGEIYCYVSFGEEVSTGGLISYSLKMGKKVAVPKIIVNNGTKMKMEFYYIDSMEELQEGYYGIMEPPAKIKACGKDVLVIMPGVAFDIQCNRIGYGKGFYDSYLSVHPDYRRIALAYGMQCLKSIPAGGHDIRPEIIITEEENYIC
ncbi:5-formyltetrahydrofolate cyclo-ligase [Faecalicatena contorta]|uniref:5-formyltetrahydrofolate cyclo-ligase n=1 Tax=Faecalicatena contorta TaxID=39482 RepID=A0A316A3B9_9FIRM|nr:5-formyltetrahydrofolate cyclo-ligase [Faecalicatena contorta]PWJ52381.1 5-formyltetrahydrofolate cyclo-ligase [Faecalicatena contorta]SUQ12659.1 5-formyltetrahydrofolate cyclo-ligase [Faecalicatena contorta]